MFVTITSLTRVPTSILNAASDGRPKQMPWGEHAGDYRQYVSSQCQKYWLRKSPAFERLSADLGMAATVRTARQFGESFAKRLVDDGMTRGDADAWVAECRALFTAGKDAPIALGEEEREALARACLLLHGQGRKAVEDVKDGKKTVTVRPLVNHLKKSPLNDEKASGLDAAIFGRMATAEHVVTVRSAMHVAPAIATRAYLPIDDFFSATDDAPREGQGRGAGHIGDKELAPPSLFLRQTVIDVDQLAHNLGFKDDAEALAKAIAGLADAFLRSFTNSGITSTGAYARTVEALVEVTDRQPTTSVEAIRESSDDAAVIWRRILSDRAAEHADYGPPLSAIALADFRDGSAPAFDTLREGVRAALLPTAKAA
jgi:CRISPR system Cascade subunit CasC